MKKFLRTYKYEILIFIFFVVVRLPHLGHDNFNTDVWKWKQRSYDFGTGVFTLNFDKTFQKYHPGVTLMWVGSTAVKISNVVMFDLFSDYFSSDIQRIFFLDRVQKLVLVVVMGMTYASAFYVFRQLTNQKYAFISFILLSLEPFYLALSRVFHLEGLMSVFMLAAVLWLYYFLQDSTKIKRLIISAVFSAWAVLTKTSALILIPFGLFSIFLFYDYQKDHINETKLRVTGWWAVAKKPISVFLLWVTVFVLAGFVSWPVLWTAPEKAINGMFTGITVVGIESEHQQYYFGNFVDDPGFLYYFVVLGLRSSLYLLFGLLISLPLIYKYSDKNTKKLLTFLLMYSILYFIEMSVVSKKLDRYILPSLMSLSLVSSYCIYFAIEKLRKLRILLFCAIIAPAVFTYWYLNFDYLSYYNPMFGGLKTGINILEPKWLIGTNEIMAYFRQLKNEQGLIDAPDNMPYEEVIYKDAYVDNILSVGFPEKYYTQIWPFFREMKGWAVIHKIKPFAIKTRYFVFPVWADESGLEDRFTLNKIGEINIRKVHTYNVYERVL